MTKCVSGTEAANDSLVAICNLAVGYPRAPSVRTTGRHPPIATSYSGGPAPIGWTKNFVGNWVKDANDAQVPISDAAAAILTTPRALSNLTVPQQTTLTNAIAARQEVDLVVAEYRVPKAKAAVGDAAEEEAKDPKAPS